MLKRMILFVMLCLFVVGCTSTTAPTATRAPTATLPPATNTPPVVEEQPPTATPVPATATLPPENTPTPTPDIAAVETKAPPTPTSTPVPPTSTPMPSEPVWQPDGTIAQDEYAYTTEVAGVTVHWINDDQYLYMAMQAQTTGWVSVGLDPENKMQGANYILGYVQDGQAVVLDMFGVQPFGPNSHPNDDTLGGRNDILAFGGKEENGTTVIEFQIPLDSGDPYDKPLASGASYQLIAAMGSDDDAMSLHTARGYGTFQID